MQCLPHPSSPVDVVSSNQFMMSDAKEALTSPTKSSGSRRGSGSKKANAKQNKDQDGKPRRPLSSYNLFFKHQRAKILETATSKYEGGKPRRSHGKIGFASLARSVAAKWNNIEPEDRKQFDELAAQDKERYNREMEVWKAEQTLKKESSHFMPNDESFMSGMPMQAVNAQTIVKCNLMAASQASQSRGRMAFSRFQAPSCTNQSRVSQRFAPSNFFQGLRGSERGASSVVGQALRLLDDDQMPSFHSLDEPTLQRVESEESQQPSRRSSTSSGVRRNSTPDISELAAKLDEECLGFMTEFLF